jgi:Spy/CpxP family protein refolding chaperone
MFKQGLLAIILAGVAYTAPAAVAQNSAAGDSQPAAAANEAGREHGRFDPQKRSQMLTKKLKLSSDQQSKVQDILQSTQSDMEKVRSDSSLSQPDRRSKMMDIHKSTNDQIRALLNPDQQKKWDTMQARRQDRMQRRSGKQQAPPSTPDQK